MKKKNSNNNNIRLGVNIDHVATIRNARGGIHPEPLKAAKLAVKSGADVITVHLREDRRHISDKDFKKLIQIINVPINLEIACTDEMVHFACKYKPNSVCIVPEKRQERTTEGGLDVIKYRDKLKPEISKMQDLGIKVALFIEPQYTQIEAASSLGVSVVELHTGRYSNLANESKKNDELTLIRDAAKHIVKTGMECHAGHGLTFENVVEIAKIDEIIELNIGHFLVGESIFVGLGEAVQSMKSIMVSTRV